MYESALTPKILKVYTGTIVNAGNAVINDSAEVTVGRTKRPIFWVTCTGTSSLATGTVTLTYMGSVAGLEYAEELSVIVTLIASATANIYIGSKAFDCDYDVIKLTKITSGARADASAFTIRVSGVARDV